MRAPIVMSLMLLTVACTSVPSELDDMEAALDLAALNKKTPQVFVLGAIEGVKAEPVVTFDHTCQGIRYMHMVRDSIVLNPDGSAVRSFVLERTANGDQMDSNPIVARGTWGRMTNTRSWYYFNQKPSIMLWLKPDDPKIPSYEMPMRLDGSNELTKLGAMGGSCAGEASDGREVQFSYTRR